MEEDALPPSSSRKFTKSKAMPIISFAKGIQIRRVLVCQRLARGYATLCDSRRSVVPVRPVLKLEGTCQCTGATRSWRNDSHKTMPMNARSIGEIILYVDNKTVTLIGFYGGSGVCA